MNILSIDSSTGKLSVAVGRDEKLLSEVVDFSSMKYMVKIMGLLDRALSRARLTLGDIDVFGANIGPGDFTGTRVGVSVIKILSWLEGKPAFGIDSLDIFALGIGLKNINLIIRCVSKDTPVLLMPCLDVRRSEVYFAFYSIKPESAGESKYMAKIRVRGSTYIIGRAGKSFLVPGRDLKDILDRLFTGSVLKIPESEDEYRSPGMIIGGSCCKSYSKVLGNIIRQNKGFYLDRKNIYPEAEYLNICAYFNKVRGVKTKNLVPVYIREFMPFGGK
jgi:tRNA threonylcarbamoyl adenosine modification protein YeaZ